MTAYVTLQDQKWVETFRVDRPGRSWQMRQDRATNGASEFFVFLLCLIQLIL